MSEPKVRIANDISGQWCIGPFDTSRDATEYWYREAGASPDDPLPEMALRYTTINGRKCVVWENRDEVMRWFAKHGPPLEG